MERASLHTIVVMHFKLANVNLRLTRFARHSPLVTRRSSLVTRHSSLVAPPPVAEKTARNIQMP